jgi:hypothetical protein
MPKNSAFDRECELKIRKLVKDSSSLGLVVRREKLTQGPSFRVKSGKCFLTGKRTVFIDKRLPPDQQLTLLIEEVSKQS